MLPSRLLARLLRRWIEHTDCCTRVCPATGPALRALTLAALALPGMVSTARADAEAEVGIQYYHYQEGERADYGIISSRVTPAGAFVPTTTNWIGKSPMLLRPVSSDGEHAYARFRLGDRARFALDYVEDIWSGASPISTQPSNVITGASTHLEGHTAYFDAHGHPLYLSRYTPNANPNTPGAAPQEQIWSRDTQLHQTMSYASPETRKQFNARYGYDWTDTAVDVGGGVSDEPDFRSTFASIAGRRDFDDKRSSVNLGLSYTHGDTHATWDTIYTIRQGTSAYPGSFPTFSIGSGMSERRITGSRNDLALTAGIVRTVNRNDVFSTGLGYTRTSGFLANPYKFVTVFYAQPDQDPNLPLGVFAFGIGQLQLERRPSLRRQFTWDTSYLHYFGGLNAAGQAHYSLFADDWGVRAHTLDVEWRQSMGDAWTVTPRLRYYSQSSADFYAPYFFSADQTGGMTDLPAHVFSSDERLSAYGTLTAGITASHQLARGFQLELGLEYQRHAGALRLGGGGEASYGDFRASSVNLALRGSLDALDRTNGRAAEADPDAADRATHRHGAHVGAPAGVMGAHLLETGQLMVSYRAEQTRLSGPMMSAGAPVALPSATGPMTMVMTGMTMNMRMLELMYAPSDRLTLMLMPSMVDSTMRMGMFGKPAMKMNHTDTERDFLSTGGFGDTGVSALYRLWSGSRASIDLSQGVSIPTGRVDLRNGQGAPGGLYAFDMQTGSGTWDYKPALTYLGGDRHWSWGAQANATRRLVHHNRSGYALGDEVQATAWAGYHWTAAISTTLRAVETQRGAVRGGIPASQQPAGLYGISDYDPRNYGGRFADLGVGVAIAPTGGALAGQVFRIEWLQPVRSAYYGTQLKRGETLAADWSVVF